MSEVGEPRYKTPMWFRRYLLRCQAQGDYETYQGFLRGRMVVTILQGIIEEYGEDGMRGISDN